MRTWEDIRGDFPLFEKHPDLIYFDSAATMQKPRDVIDAMHAFYLENYATVHRGVYSLARESTEMYHGVRRKIQAFLNAPHVEEVLFTRGTTAALNLVAKSYGSIALTAGDYVLIPEIEHHSNIVPWQMICQEMGAHLLTIPVDNRGEICFDSYLELLKKNPKIVSLAHVSNVLGTIHPLKKIIASAHAHGAVVCVDGAQAVAHLPVDVQALDADFYAFSSHKMGGPTGIGVLYGKKHLLEKMPPLEGGGDMVDIVTWEKTTFQPLPLKFEAGTPSIVEVIGLGAAIDYLSTLDRRLLLDHEHSLMSYATEKFSTIPGIRLLGTASQKGPIISFVVEGVHPLDLATLLDCKQIAIRTGHQCSQPTMQRFGITSCLRLSFALYNNHPEIDRFTSALEETLSLLSVAK